MGAEYNQGKGDWRNFKMDNYPPEKPAQRTIQMNSPYENTISGEFAFYGHMHGGQKAYVVKNNPHEGMKHVNPYPKNKKGVS